MEMEPIGFVSTDVEDIPRSWRVSDVEGTLVINEEYMEELSDIGSGQRLHVVFHFHKSPKFTPEFLWIKPKRASWLAE
jgi:tRNA (Thr-GGU) A37 N-methylase